MEIREILEDEREAAFYLGSQAFSQGSRDMGRMDHPDRPARSSFGVWDSAGLQAAVSVIKYNIHLGAEATVPMGGVAGVACLPASRGKGYAGACMKFALERMRDEGQAVSTLFPFSYHYYDKLGWAWTGTKRTYTVATSALRAAPETESVRAAAEADRPAIAQAYTDFARRYRGAVVRDEKMWNQVLNSTDTQYRYTYIYDPDGQAEGYLTYVGGKREETRLREFIALSPRARRALLGLLRRHEMQIEKFKWDAPSDDPLWSTLMHWDLDTTIQPHTMARIVDVPAAFAAWRPRPDVNGAVSIAVQDKCAPWNCGVWSVEFGGGKAVATPASGTAQVTLDIRALSQAYFGSPTPAELHAEGRLGVRDEAGYLALCDLLAGPPMWMNDSF